MAGISISPSSGSITAEQLASGVTFTVDGWGLEETSLACHVHMTEYSPDVYYRDDNNYPNYQAWTPNGFDWKWGDVPSTFTVKTQGAITENKTLMIEIMDGAAVLDDYVKTFSVIATTDAGEPTSPKVASTLSREAVELSWGSGSAGTNNSVTGYDVQYRESSDGSSWGSWTTANGSPVTGTKLNVAPSGTVGNYRQYRVRTRGSAGENYYSDWVTSTNTLRRKWNAFGAWTDATLTAGVSGIRAVHMTQLQERVAVIRAFYGMAAYSFTAVTARKTKIAKWAALIQEIRNAIDEVTTNHEAWNTLQAGKPRIAHITQLRKIIDEM